MLATSDGSAESVKCDQKNERRKKSLFNDVFRTEKNAYKLNGKEKRRRNSELKENVEDAIFMSSVL